MSAAIEGQRKHLGFSKPKHNKNQLNSTKDKEADKPVCFADVLKRDLRPFEIPKTGELPRGVLKIDSNIDTSNKPEKKPKKSRRRERNKNNVQVKKKKERLIDKPIVVYLKQALSSPKRSKSLVATPVSKQIVEESTVKKKKGKTRPGPKQHKPSVLKKVILHERILRRSKSLSNLPSHSGPVKLSFDGDLVTDENKLPSAVIEKRTVNKTLIYPKRLDWEKSLRDIIVELTKYHDQAYKKYPTDSSNLKKNRRIVTGFHEVIKYSLSGHMKFVVFARDLEGKAGLYRYDNENESEEDPDILDTSFDMLHYKESMTAITDARSVSFDMYVKAIVKQLQRRCIPFIFGYTRKLLREMCRKMAKVSVIGIINTAGVEMNFQKFLREMDDRTELATEQFDNPFDFDALQSCLDFIK